MQITFGIDDQLPFRGDHIQTALKRPGIHRVAPDAERHRVTVDFDPAQVDQTQIQLMIQGIGFRPYVINARDAEAPTSP